GAPDWVCSPPPGPHTQVCPYTDSQSALVKRLTGKSLRVIRRARASRDYQSPVRSQANSFNLEIVSLDNFLPSEYEIFAVTCFPVRIPGITVLTASWPSV